MKILYKKILGEVPDSKVVRIDVHAPHIARTAKPGQFVALMVSKEGERIPLTIVDKDTSKGTVTLIFQELGLTTRLLGRLKKGDSLYVLVGPLGRATEIKRYGKVMVIGGGIGIAEIYPVARAFKDAGNHITAILGVRTKDILILEKELKSVSDKLYVTTDDGSYGKKGFTTDILEELLSKNRYDLVYAVGPIPMMMKASAITKASGTKTIVSLNAIMVDATGMCGCCRVEVGGKMKFSCVDGPEFDASLVDWDGLIKRNKVYLDKETHICKLNRL